jgi:hypothetical protein
MTLCFSPCAKHEVKWNRIHKNKQLILHDRGKFDW